MKQRLLKMMAIFAAGFLISGISGCGARLPTTSDELSEGEQDKLTVSSEIVTAGEETEVAVD
jgi:hypothetical protein